MKKGTANMLLIGIAVAIGAVLLVPGLADSVIAIITDVPQTCTIAPYDWECTCPAGFEKRPAWPEESGFAYQYYCALAVQPAVCEFPITYTDVNDAVWQAEVLGCAQELLTTGCGECQFIDCASPAWVSYSYLAPQGDDPKGYGYVECQEQTEGVAGTIRWAVIFSLEDGSFHPVLRTACETPAGEYCQLGGIIY